MDFTEIECTLMVVTSTGRRHYFIYVCGMGQRSRYSKTLGAELSGDRIPVQARHSALVQTDPGAQPTSCKRGVGSLSRG